MEWSFNSCENNQGEYLSFIRYRNTYHLQDIEGKSLPYAWHSDHLKLYYNE
jgi:hypothetical protein